MFKVGAVLVNGDLNGLNTGNILCVLFLYLPPVQQNVGCSLQLALLIVIQGPTGEIGLKPPNIASMSEPGFVVSNKGQVLFALFATRIAKSSFMACAALCEHKY